MQKKYKLSLFLFLMALMCVPVLQQHFKFFNEKPTGGYFPDHPEPDLSRQSWFSGSFSNDYSSFFNNNIGFRNTLIRCRNQFYYSVLKTSGEPDYIVGRNQNIFYINNIRSVNGDDFKGKDFICSRIKKLQLVYDSLKARGIPLFVCIAPGKANLFSEDIPKKFVPADSSKTNYYWLVKCLKETTVPLLNFHEYYKAMKDTTHHPLFTLGSLHWTTYQLTYSYDSMLSFMKSLSGKPVPHLNITSSFQSDSASGQEMDQLEPMNILSKLRKEKYYYPVFKIEGQEKKPKMLVISDSFFLSFAVKHLTDSTLDYECWFYHHDLYPETYTKPTTIDEIDYWGDIFKQDYICIMMSEVAWGEAGFEFVDNACNYFTEGNNYIVSLPFNEVMRKIEENNKYIASTASNHDLELQKAQEHNWTLDKMIYRDAIYITDYGFEQHLSSPQAGKIYENLLKHSVYVNRFISGQPSPYASEFSPFIVEAMAKYFAMKKYDYNKLSQQLNEASGLQ